MSKRKTAAATPDATSVPVRVLEAVIQKSYEALLKGAEEKPTIGGLAKMIELYTKVAPGDAAQKELWTDLEKIRQKVLGGETPPAAPKETTGRSRKRKKKGD